MKERQKTKMFWRGMLSRAIIRGNDKVILCVSLLRESQSVQY